MPTIFISYCQDDKEWLDLLLQFLSPLFEKHAYKTWCDRNINEGDDWDKEIKRAIQGASIALLLVTPAFLFSEYAKKELELILKERSRGLKVLWIPVKRAIWEAGTLASIQAALDPEVFLEEFNASDRGKALETVAKKIEKAFRTPVPDVSTTPTETRRSKLNEIAVAVDTHDTARIKRLTTEKGISEESLLSDLLHKALFHEELNVTYRYESEIQGKDQLLQSASRAQFIGLTYKTLGLALTEGGLRLPNIAHIEVAVYALPILKFWHPTLRGETYFHKLHKEWTLGVRTVLTMLISKEVAPELQTLDLRLLNRVPTFTSSLLTTKSLEGDLLRIRFTPALEGVEPAATPTISPVIYTGAGARTEPLFDAYARILDDMRSRSRPLVFPILRGGQNGYIRPKLQEFVKRLESTTNDARYSQQEATFEVTAKIDVGLAREFGISANNAGSEVHPDSIYLVFDELRASESSSDFKVTFDMRKHKALILAGTAATEEWVEVKVSRQHTVGVFAVLTKRTQDGRVAILKVKQKPAWSHDVPGGRVAHEDKSIEDTVARELVEELGLEIRPTGLRDVYEYKYDPGGELVKMPVIAVYYHYRLNDEEARYLEQILPNATDGFPLEEVDIENLINAKSQRRHNCQHIPILYKDAGAEAVCHAPLEVFLRIDREDQAVVAG